MRRAPALVVMIAVLACGLWGCGSSAPRAATATTAATRSSAHGQEETLCRHALSDAADAAAKLAARADVSRSALQSYLELFQHELTQVVQGLRTISRKASGPQTTLNEAIQLDQATLRRDAHALTRLRAEHTTRLTQGQVHTIFAPVAHSESAAAVHLATSTFPTVCLGSA